MTTSRHRYYQNLYDELCLVCVNQLSDYAPEGSDTAEFLNRVRTLQSSLGDPDSAQEGQALLSQIVASFPLITPQMHRDLLWFFGGDCLHYLSDEELDKYQLLEERYYEAGSDGDEGLYRNLRAQTFGLH